MVLAGCFCTIRATVVVVVRPVQALAQGKHSLTFLNVSKNKLADEGMQTLAEGFVSTRLHYPVSASRRLS